MICKNDTSMDTSSQSQLVKSCECRVYYDKICLLLILGPGGKIDRIFVITN